MSVNRPAAPVRDALVDVKGEYAGKVTSVSWLTWLRGLVDGIAAAPEGFEPLVYPNQAAAIVTTAFPTDGDLSAGLYRVGWYGQVITPAGVSSSFQVTLSWTLNGVTQTLTGALMNGNTTTTRECNGAQVIAIDASSPITVAVAYASNPASAMAFNFYAHLERLAVL